MSTTNFIAHSTVIESSWLNDVDAFIYQGVVSAGASWYPSAANKLIYTSAAGQLTSLTTAVSSYLTTDGAGNLQWTAASGGSFASASTTITVAGTANEITSSAGAQDLSANRTWTLSLPAALTFTGKTITGGTYSSPSIAKLANLTSNGVVYTSGGDGTLSVDTATHYKAGGTDVALADGGTNASLVADLGAIVYSTGSALGLLASTATASKMLLSGSSAAPTWSTSTIPTSAGATANKHLISDGTNYVLSANTFPNASATSLKWMRSDGTNWIASTATLAEGAVTALKHLRSDGTNWIATTATISDTPSTALKWLRSDGTNWITSTSTFAEGGVTALKHLRSDGTNWIASTATISDTPSTSGKIMVSDGTNWITSTPTFPNASATAGKQIRSDGTNWLASTYTIPDTYAAGDILYASATSVLTALAKDTNATRYLSNKGASNIPSWAQVTMSDGVTGVLPVANGGTNASSASITAFNNITGYTAAGSTGTTSTNLVFSTSPTFTTPLLGTPTSGVLTNCTGYVEASLVVTDVTTNDVTTSAHGFAPKAPNDTTKFLNGAGAWTVPAGSGGSGIDYYSATYNGAP
jgi:hypothetical protein